MISTWIKLIKPIASSRSQFLRICVAVIIASVLIQGAVFKHLEESHVESVSQEKKWKFPRRQRVLLLSGPLQSGLSKLNSDISQWSKSYKLGGWSWSIPEITNYNYTRDQGFDPLVDSMVYGLSHKLEMGPRYRDTRREVADYFLKEYRAAFVAEWMKNKSILVGSEKFFTAANGKIIESFVDMLPWNHPQFSLSGSKDDITVLICYRPSRVQHLASLWRTSVDYKKLSFSKWLLSSDRINDIDALGLAEEFVKRGISVIIMDVEDVLKNHLDLGYYISCNILDAPCNNHIIVGLEDFNSTMPALDLSYDLNHVGLNDAAIKQIERTLGLYDCNFQYYRSHKEVELLNGSLKRLFSKCDFHQDATKSVVIPSRGEVTRKIAQIVQK